MKKIAPFYIFLLLLVGSMALANAEQDEGKGIEKPIIGTTDQISDIDIMGNGFGNWRFTLTDCGLLRYNSKGENIPDLAESWETDDWKKFTFHLRNNAYFHDEVPITANNFKFTIE